MNTARLIVIGLVGLLIGVLLGFSFRGSLAQLLNLEAQDSSVATMQVDETVTVESLSRDPLKSNYSRAKSVFIPATILFTDQQLNRRMMKLYPWYRPYGINFDLGTITPAEKAAVDKCMESGLTTPNATNTNYSTCLIENVIKPRATKP
jgi:hypothetical protein